MQGVVGAWGWSDHNVTKGKFCKIPNSFKCNAAMQDSLEENQTPDLRYPPVQRVLAQTAIDISCYPEACCSLITPYNSFVKVYLHVRGVLSI